MTRLFNKKLNSKGFTLIETMVSLMMVSIAFLGIYGAVAKYSQQTKQIKENYVASLLGQEGIEVVRNMRDKNWVTAAAWDNGLTSCSGCSGRTNGCQAAYNATTLSAYNDTTGYLYINSGFYDYSGTGTLTPYKRQICIDESGSILHVVVNVYWTGGKQATVKEDLYNWKW
jgi:prepilin-type N-terminal cleavage/methylation domain-containing protein